MVAPVFLLKEMFIVFVQKLHMETAVKVSKTFKLKEFTSNADIFDAHFF